MTIRTGIYPSKPARLVRKRGRGAGIFGPGDKTPLFPRDIN